MPVAEGWPPFLVVADVGHTIELYADFSGTGKRYLPFPDARSHRLRLADLAQEATHERLRAELTEGAPPASNVGQPAQTAPQHRGAGLSVGFAAQEPPFRSSARQPAKSGGAPVKGLGGHRHAGLAIPLRPV